MPTYVSYDFQFPKSLRLGIFFVFGYNVGYGVCSRFHSISSLFKGKCWFFFFRCSTLDPQRCVKGTLTRAYIRFRF